MKVVLVLGAIAAVLFLAVLGLLGGQTTSWNQRVTLVIETPQGEVRGSAVREVKVSCYSNASLNFGTEVAYELTGEAAAIEILPDKYLFALIAGDEVRFAGAARDRLVGKTRCEWLKAIPRQRDAVTLTGSLIPMLVTFDDVTNPETAREVKPDDLAAVFGEGVKLKAVTLEITRESVTEGRVEKVLGWLDRIGGGTLDGAKISSIQAKNRLANDLSRWDFLRP